MLYNGNVSIRKGSIGSVSTLQFTHSHVHGVKLVKFHIGIPRMSDGEYQLGHLIWVVESLSLRVTEWGAFKESKSTVMPYGTAT